MTIIFHDTLSWGMSRTAARQRFRHNQDQQRQLDTLINRVVPESKRSLVVYGAFWGRAALRGERGRSPIRSMRRALSRHARVLVIGEHRSSRVCHACGEETPQAEAHPRRSMEVGMRALLRRVLSHVRRMERGQNPEAAYIHPEDVAALRHAVQPGGVLVHPDQPLRVRRHNDAEGDWSESVTLTRGGALAMRVVLKTFNGI